jgi:hypothetical protein
VQLGLKQSAVESALKPALAALLACLLVVSTTLSVTHVLHQSESHSNGHSCFVCSLAKGHVSAAAAAPIFVVFVSTVLFSIPLLRIRVFAASDRRLCHGRAPPVSTALR